MSIYQPYATKCEKPNAEISSSKGKTNSYQHLCIIKLCILNVQIFYYVLLVWRLTSKKRLQKIKKTQERCLRLLLNNQTKDYKYLLKESKSPSMEVRRLRILAIDVFKILSVLNSVYG